MNHLRFDNESMSLLEQLRDLHEGFMVALCQVLGLVYEEAITVDVVNAVKALKAERQWIPFSERLPDKCGFIMIYTPQYSETIHIIWYHTDEPTPWKFTHWQPLPEPPTL